MFNYSPRWYRSSPKRFPRKNANQCVTTQGEAGNKDTYFVNSRALFKASENALNALARPVSYVTREQPDTAWRRQRHRSNSTKIELTHERSSDNARIRHSSRVDR